MKNKGIISPIDIINVNEGELEALVRPSGYYRQKARKLREFTDFVLGCGGFRRFSKKVSREALLGVRGIGPETADSIILYAMEKPVFVIDAYTRRILDCLGVADRDSSYDYMQHIFSDNLPRSAKLFNEYHALLVEHAKRVCRKRPDCQSCVLYRLRRKR